MDSGQPTVKRTTAKNFDFLTKEPPPNLTEFQKFIRDRGSHGILGPVETWPTQLRQLILIVVADPDPSIIYWGEEGTAIYNEAYTHLVGSKHPGLQGGDPKIHFAEIWTPFQTILDKGKEDGLTHVGRDQLLLLHRYGYLEETYFTFKFIPIIGPDGDVVGSYATVVETTKEVLANRRLKCVNHLAQEIATATDITELWSKIISGLENNEHDIPLAMLYAVEDAATLSELGLTEYSPERTICSLQGKIGIPSSHPCAPLRMELDRGTDPLTMAFQDVRDRGVARLLSAEDNTLPSELLTGINWRGFGVPCTRAVICPISSASSRQVLGYLLLGLNPRRPYDEDYRNFIHLITREITTPHVSAVLLREEVRRGQSAAKQAVLDRSKLSQQLLRRTQEYEESKIRFERFAERAEVGLTLLDEDGHILWASDRWYDITMHPRNDPNAVSWLDSLLPEDRPMVDGMWKQLQQGQSVSYQARLVKKEPGSVGVVSILVSAYCDYDETGRKTIMGWVSNNRVDALILTVSTRCLTDISALKWAENQLLSRSQELERSESRWRNFTDKAPVGVVLMDSSYRTVIANDAFLEILGHEAEDDSPLSWLSRVVEEDAFTLTRLFQDLPTFDGPITIEFRLKQYWKSREESQTRTRRTILCSFHAIMEGTRKVQEVIGWFTDISAQKAAEDVLRKRMDQAIEMKHQQENFIDVSVQHSSSVTAKSSVLSSTSTL
jgi:PAS domain S-box-containing protein